MDCIGRKINLHCAVEPGPFQFTATSNSSALALSMDRTRVRTGTHRNHSKMKQKKKKNATWNKSDTTRRLFATMKAFYKTLDESNILLDMWVSCIVTSGTCTKPTLDPAWGRIQYRKETRSDARRTNKPWSQPTVVVDRMVSTPTTLPLHNPSPRSLPHQ
ncbi:MAG: hypothetical protein J3Q66DRAFT_185705 [Benniella sp.]|nr:MAG: hypothetical protein J3Q66DRAFT_185705 [Benniella sp.]